ncbi:hypothetical protein ASG52_25300 [Methylobacterium sp. Leaf456]|nr:hypothetical protein ASG52_25300 [Methylobacterium sp. Leaf456]
MIDEVGEVVVVPSGELSFGVQGAFGGVLAQDGEGQAAQQGEVLSRRGIAGEDVVLAEGEVVSRDVV